MPEIIDVRVRELLPGDRCLGSNTYILDVWPVRQGARTMRVERRNGRTEVVRWGASTTMRVSRGEPGSDDR